MLEGLKGHHGDRWRQITEVPIGDILGNLESILYGRKNDYKVILSRGEAFPP